MRVSGFIAVLLIVAALTGCSTTLFASLPEGAITHCDSHWPGRWIPADAANAGIEISANCRSAITLKHGERSREAAHLTLVSSVAGDYLSYRRLDNRAECLASGRCGYALMRYVRDGNEIRLYDLDHNAMANAIAAGTVAGETTDTAPGTAAAPPIAPRHQNFVHGNARQIAGLLQAHPELFEAEPFLTLRREEATPSNLSDPSP